MGNPFFDPILKRSNTAKNINDLAILESLAYGLADPALQERATELRSIIKSHDNTGTTPEQTLALNITNAWKDIYGVDTMLWPEILKDSLETMNAGVGFANFGQNLTSAFQNLRLEDITIQAFEAGVAVTRGLSPSPLPSPFMGEGEGGGADLIPESAARAGLSFISSPFSLFAPLMASGIAGRTATSLIANAGRALSLADEAIAGLATLFGLLGESTAFVVSSDVVAKLALPEGGSAFGGNSATTFLQEISSSAFLFGGLKAFGRFGAFVRTFLPETEAGLALAKLAAHATSVAGLAVMEPVQDLAGIAPMTSKNFYEALWRALFLHTTITATNGIINLEGVKNRSPQLSQRATALIEKLNEALNTASAITTTGREFKVPMLFASTGSNEPPSAKEPPKAEETPSDPDMLVIKVGKPFKLPENVPDEPAQGLTEYPADPDKAAEALEGKITIGADESRKAEEDTAVTGISSIPTETKLLAELERVALCYQAYAKRNLGRLKDVLDYVARKHRYGTLPLEEMTDEITQELPTEEPPEFYNIYSGAETLLASQDMPRFRSGNLIGRIESPRAKWGIEKGEHQYWTFYYAKDFFAPSVEGRFYITIDPSLYKGLIGEMASELQTRMKSGNAAKKFYFKLTNEVQKDGTAVRRDHLVVYFKNADGPAVRASVEDAMQKIEARRPNAFSEKGPYFTMNVRRGLYFGEQPRSERESFGGLRSAAINNAMNEIQWMLNEGFTVTPEERAYIVAAVFEANDIDPEFPAFNIGGREKFSYLFEPSDIQGPVVSPARVHDDLTAPTTTGFTPEGREHVVNFDLANGWPSGADEIMIGRTPAADIAATQRYISREHAKLVRNGDGTYTLVDICNKQLIGVQTLDEEGVDFVELDFIGPGSENLGRRRDQKTLKPGKRYRVIIGEVVIEFEVPHNTFAGNKGQR